MSLRSLTLAMSGCLAALLGLGVFAADGEKPVRGGTLIYPVHNGEPSTLDCHAAQSPNVVWRIGPHYSSLLQIDADNFPAVKGDLAESWQVSSDGLSYEFKLHPNIRFHDGSPLTSHDVKVSIDRMRNPPSGVVSLRADMLRDIRSVEAPSPDTVVLRLAAPNAAMLQILGSPYACILSAKLLDSDPSYPRARIMGSGPFKFIRYTAGSEWIGERFDAYFREGLPYLDGFRALTVSGPAAINAVIAGQVHYNLRGLTDAEVVRIRNARGSEVNFVGEGSASTVHHLVALNTEHPALADVRVRRALALAMDRWAGAVAMKQITSMNIPGGLIRPGSAFARSTQELEHLPGFSRNIQAARAESRRLLKEAGHSNLKLNFVYNSLYGAYGVLIADQLRQVGVTVETRPVDSVQNAARKRSGEYDMIFDYLPEYLEDPTIQLNWFVPFEKNPANLSRANDPKLEALYEAQKRELDPAKRRQHVLDLEAHALEQAYVIPLYWQEWQRAISKDVGGLKAMRSNFLKVNLADIWLRSGGK